MNSDLDQALVLKDVSSWSFEKLATTIQPKEKTMTTLKRLVGVIALTSMFAFAAFADCVPPAPGEVNSPPCLSAQITPDDPVASAEQSVPSTSNSAAVEISVTTLDVLLSVLSIF